MNRPISEYFTIAAALFRGIFARLKIDSCGALLRVDKKVRIIHRNCDIKLGRKVNLHAGVKLSGLGNAGKRSELIIGDGVAVGDRTEDHAGNSDKDRRRHAHCVGLLHYGPRLPQI